MGSLDVREAKAQFLLLIDKVNGTHLPGFAIWLDSKLAEYKVQGAIKADDEMTSEQQYPEWISRSLRQNLSFIFQEEKSSTPLGLSSPVSEKPKSVAKRKLFTQPEGSSNPKLQRLSSTNSANNTLSTSREVDRAAVTEIQDIIKLEGSSDEDNDGKLEQRNTPAVMNCSVSRPGVVETPMPLLGQAFSLPSSVSSDPSTNVFSPSNQYSTTSSPVATTQHTAVSSPGAAYQHPTLSSIGQHSVQIKSNFESPVSVARVGDSSAHGRVETGPAASSEPGSVSVHRLAAWPSGIYRGMTQRPSLLSSNRQPKSNRQCPVCKKTFTQTYYLKTHMRCHTGERPYACRVCGKRFSQSSSCYDHERRVHNFSSLSCANPGSENKE